MTVIVNRSIDAFTTATTTIISSASAGYAERYADAVGDCLSISSSRRSVPTPAATARLHLRRLQLLAQPAPAPLRPSVPSRPGQPAQACPNGLSVRPSSQFLFTKMKILGKSGRLILTKNCKNKTGDKNKSDLKMAIFSFLQENLHFQIHYEDFQICNLKFKGCGTFALLLTGNCWPNSVALYCASATISFFQLFIEVGQ